MEAIDKQIAAMHSCDLCGSSVENHSVVLAVGSLKIGAADTELHTVMCKVCKFVFQREVFNDDLLDYLYSHDHGFDFTSPDQDSQRVLAYKRRRQKFVSEALANLDSGCRLSVLDIGGGVGDCTEHLADNHDVWLLDIHDQAPLDPRIKKVIGLFEKTEFDAPFDLVIMNHVLEHVFFPTRFLRKAHERLYEGGWLAIEVPFELYTPLVFRKIGDWRHVVYFSQETLRIYLQKAGFVPRSLVLTTGYYGDRKLPVIRAVAQKVLLRDIGPIQCGIFSGIVKDMLNPRAFALMAAPKLGIT